MEEAGEDYYEKILYKGQKLTSPRTLGEKAKGSLDQAPKIRATVVRKVGGKPINQLVVTQVGFSDDLKETRTMQVVSTLGGRRKLKNLTPIEQQEINQSLLGVNDTEVDKKANTQRAAIRSHTKKP